MIKYKSRLKIKHYNFTSVTTRWPWWYETIFWWLRSRSSTSLPICHAKYLPNFHLPKQNCTHRGTIQSQSRRNVVLNHHGHPVPVSIMVPWACYSVMISDHVSYGTIYCCKTVIFTANSHREDLYCMHLHLMNFTHFFVYLHHYFGPVS